MQTSCKFTDINILDILTDICQEYKKVKVVPFVLFSRHWGVKCQRPWVFGE